MTTIYTIIKKRSDVQDGNFATCINFKTSCTRCLKPFKLQVLQNFKTPKGSFIHVLVHVQSIHCRDYFIFPFIIHPTNKYLLRRRGLEPVVIRKKAPTAAARKDEKAINAARRAGAEIETVRKGT
uniref:Putative multiprotein bridging factor n=1 Tax=Helianthus annuus TaxID=4232 RepID=A0A251TYN4_HELAN